MIDEQAIKKWMAVEVKERMDDLSVKPYHVIAKCNMADGEVRSCLEGKTFPSLFNLVLLADCLECTVNDLLGYDEVEDTEIYEKYTASSMYFAESQYAVCLAYRVRQYLDERFMTLTGLAKKMDINVANLQRWFSKTRPHLPMTSKFLQICEALECTPSELLGY